MSDYFLIHRALQVQRICGSEVEHGIELPGKLARDGLSSQAVAFLRCVDRIRKLPLDEKAGGGIMRMLRIGRARTDNRLTPKQRSLILDFERQLVELRLLEDPVSQKLAGGCIQAILRDRSFFYGLKPLAQHTEAFAHELLYPTWLNLYTAMRQRCDDGVPKFSEDQAQQILNCLREIEASCDASSQPVIGLLTFVANRYSTTDALKLVRRLTRLWAADAGFAPRLLTRIDMLLKRSTMAEELCEMIPAYLDVECGLQGERDDRPENVTRVPFPAMLTGRLWELLEPPGDFDEFRTLLINLGKITRRAGGIDENLGKLFLAADENVLELVDLCLPEDPSQPAFSCQVQRLIARLIELEAKANLKISPEVKCLAQRFGGRLDALAPQDLLAFVREFVENPKNRAVLLALTGDPQKRQRVAGQLLEAARRENDPGRLFYRLQAAAVVGTWQDCDGLDKIRSSIDVLQVSRRDESISDRELSELMDDLRQHLPDSLSYLESPGFAGRGKSDRIARIYLALNEALQFYAETGKVPNFGLVRAGFRVLDQLADE